MKRYEPRHISSETYNTDEITFPLADVARKKLTDAKKTRLTKASRDTRARGFTLLEVSGA